MTDIRGLDGACTVRLGDAPLDYVEDPESQAVRLATGRIIELSPVGHHPLSHYATRSSGSPDSMDHEIADLTFGGVSDDAVLCFYWHYGGLRLKACKVVHDEPSRYQIWLVRGEKTSQISHVAIL
jgi:hypothetical protein